MSRLAIYFWRHNVMWQSGSQSSAHSEHSCGGHSNVWRTLASLVTEGLQLRASEIIARSPRAVEFASLVLLAYIIQGRIQDVIRGGHHAKYKNLPFLILHLYINFYIITSFLNKHKWYVWIVQLCTGDWIRTKKLTWVTLWKLLDYLFWVQFNISMVLKHC